MFGFRLLPNKTNAVTKPITRSDDNPKETNGSCYRDLVMVACHNSWFYHQNCAPRQTSLLVAVLANSENFSLGPVCSQSGNNVGPTRLICKNFWLAVNSSICKLNGSTMVVGMIRLVSFESLTNQKTGCHCNRDLSIRFVEGIHLSNRTIWFGH